MRQLKFYPDKQQYNNAKFFPVYVVAVKVVDSEKTTMNVST